MRHEPFYEYRKNIFGQETRKLITGHTEECPFCFGTGKKHFKAIKTSCSTCNGVGEVTKSVWEKSIFGSEVKRVRSSRCTTCDGKVFSWKVGEAFRDTHCIGSNV